MEFALQKTVCASEVKMNVNTEELAGLMNVSVKTVEHWESSGGQCRELLPACPMGRRRAVGLERQFPLRLRYLNQNRLCTIIDVNDREQRVKIKNYVTDPCIGARCIRVRAASVCAGTSADPVRILRRGKTAGRCDALSPGDAGQGKDRRKKGSV